MKIIAAKLSKKGEQVIRNNHPWIFSDSIIKIPDDAETGDLAIIFSFKNNKPIGVGLYDKPSPIAIKMLHFGGSKKIDTDFFRTKIQEAYNKRYPLFKTQTNAYRLIFGENDGFPGLIADVYDNILVLKLYSQIWTSFIEILGPLLLEISTCHTLVLRLSRKLQQQEKSIHDGQVLIGDLDSETIVFKEHGIHFSANVIKGHKTGYFLDHRHNRKLVGELASNKTLLDVFSYAGGFAVHALARGAKEVTCIDVSKQALELAIENGKLNTFKGKHKTLEGDAFELLKELVAKKKTFDIVVIDPPSFAKNKDAIPKAKKKYFELAILGSQLVAPKGTLILASCSSRITSDEFFEIHKESLPNTFECIKTTAHDLDHPVAFPEGAYLKTGYYKRIR